MKQTHLSPREKVTLDAYREIVGKYLPAVLIKCTKYTNSKRLAEIITRFTFTGTYHLLHRLDGSNKISVILESMLNIVGPNYSDKPDCPVGGKLFERKDELRSASTLTELDMEECLSRMNGIISGFDQNLYERIIESVTTYLKNSNQNLMIEKHRFNGENIRVR